jgi:hypothetical protein
MSITNLWLGGKNKPERLPSSTLFVWQTFHIDSMALCRIQIMVHVIVKLAFQQGSEHIDPVPSLRPM